VTGRIHVDPVNGDDANDGLTPETAKKTMAAAYAAVPTQDPEVAYVPFDEATGLGGYFVTRNEAALNRIGFKKAAFFRGRPPWRFDETDE
jgi:hypothetical protein